MKNGKKWMSLMVLCLITGVLGAEATGPADIPAAMKQRPTIQLSPACVKWQAQPVNELGQKPAKDKWQKVDEKRGVTYNLKKDNKAAWFKAEIKIPSDWQKGRSILNVPFQKVGAKVFVNGKEAGEILPYGDQCDLSGLIKYGAVNELELYFPLGGEGIKSLDRVSKVFVEAMKKKLPHMLSYVGVVPPYDGFCIENLSSEVVIEDVWYRTYTRGYRRIEPQVTVRSQKAMMDLVFRVVIVDAATGEKACDQSFPVPRLRVGENVVDLVIDAKGLKLWSIREPNLYWGQVFIVGKDKKELDCSNPVRFGIREFWIQGNRFYMNNSPVHFVHDGLYLKWENLEDAAKAGVTLMHSDNGWCPYLSTNNPLKLVNFCDTHGVGCMTPGVIASSLFASPTPDLKDPQVLRDYRKWVKHHQRRLRNHPSILFYSLSACQGGTHGDFRPDKLGSASDMIWNLFDLNTSHIIQKQMDPTRVYYVHGGPLVGDVSTGLIYFNHIPHQEVEDWLELWEKEGDRPVMANEFSGTRLYVDFARGRMPMATEFDARLRGDKAYLEEKDEYVNYAVNGWLGNDAWKSIWNFNPLPYSPGAAKQIEDGHERTYRAWRFRGAPCYGWQWNPKRHYRKDQQGEYAQKIWEGHLRAIKPEVVWLGGPPDNWTEKGHNFYSGDKITKSVIAIRDLNGLGKWHVAWQAELQGQKAPVASGKFTRRVGAFAREKMPFTFVAPEVTKPTSLTVSFTVNDTKGGRLIGKDSFTTTIYPKKEINRASLTVKKGWAILDPEGETSKWLRQLGFFVPDFKGDLNGIKVLILGRRALKYLKALPFSAEDIAQGLRVAIFEQHCPDLKKYGFRMEDRCPRDVFIRQQSHPLADGLDRESLRDWQGEATLFHRGPERDNPTANNHFFHWSNRGNVASAIIEIPQAGPFSSIMECEFDLDYSPLLTWRHGKGEIIYCLLDLTDRIGKEPAADLVAGNLIKYLEEKPVGPEQNRTVLCLDKDTLSEVTKLGYKGELLKGEPVPGKDIVVVEGNKAKELAGKAAVFDAFVKKGGDVLILAAGKELLDQPVFGQKIQLEKKQMSRAGRTVDKNALLRGAGPENIHWRDVVEMPVLKSNDKEFVSLLGGLMGIMPEGKGRFIFLQPSPEAFADLSVAKAKLAELSKDKKNKIWPMKEFDQKVAKRLQNNRRRSVAHVERLRSIVLGNLGAESHAQLVDRLFKPRFGIQMKPVNDWMYLGAFVPPKEGNCLDKDLSKYLKERSLEAKYTNARGEKVQWYTPTDYNNGLGINGKMVLSKAYPRHLRDLVIAATQVWSSRPRTATIRFGADWWLKILVNGKEVYETASGKGRFGIKFNNKLEIPLKKGWNDIVCIVGAGSNNHMFWFKMDDPGDLRVAQSITKPKDVPGDLPPVADLVPEKQEPGFSYYTANFQDQDPYAFYAW